MDLSKKSSSSKKFFLGGMIFIEGNEVQDLLQFCYRYFLHPSSIPFIILDFKSS